MDKCKYRSRDCREECPNMETMRKQFIRGGYVEGCAMCCQMCLNRQTCQFVCDYIAQQSLW